MRPIDEPLRERFLSPQQTAAANADPRAIVWITRPTTPLTDAEFLEQSTAGAMAGLTACDVAVRRPDADREPDAVYIAYVASGIAGVKFSATAANIDDYVWQSAGFTEPADDVAIAFDGTMPRAVGQAAEFVTEARPWVFWTHGGHLYGRILGLLGDTELAAANATAVTAVRATWSAPDSGDFGLVVFFLLSGEIYYRQLIDGQWTDAAPVSFGPPGVTWADIAAFRTWDYRIGIQGITTGGDVYELFTQFQGIARHGTERIDLNATARGKMTPIDYHSTAETEHISLSAASVAPYGGLYRLGTPSIVAAANSDDGAGNWGRHASFTFDRHLRADLVIAQPTAFRIVDAYGRRFVAQAAELSEDGYTVHLTFQDFNAAAGLCSAIYTPGTVRSMADIALPELSVSFSPGHLAPPAVPAPEATGAVNAGAETIIVSFDRAYYGAAGVAAHFYIAAQRPEYAPDGTLVSVALPVVSITQVDDTHLRLSLGNDNLSNLEGTHGPVSVVYDGAGSLVGDGGPVLMFSLTFTPTGIDHKPNQNDAEHIEISARANGVLTRVYHTDAAETEHIALSVTATGVLTKVGDL